MPKLPDPPSASELANRLPARVVTLPAGSELWRIYFQGRGNTAKWGAFRQYGPLLSARFDHHLPPPRDQERGILYAAAEIVTCVAEVFQVNRLIDTRDRLPWLVGFRVRRDLALLDLTGNWPTTAGASMLINAGRRDRARAWSRTIYDAYPHVEGLRYGSSIMAPRCTGISRRWRFTSARSTRSISRRSFIASSPILRCSTHSGASQWSLATS